MKDYNINKPKPTKLEKALLVELHNARQAIPSVESLIEKYDIATSKELISMNAKKVREQA